MRNKIIHSSRVYLIKLPVWRSKYSSSWIFETENTMKDMTYNTLYDAKIKVPTV